MTNFDGGFRKRGVVDKLALDDYNNNGGLN